MIVEACDFGENVIKYFYSSFQDGILQNVPIIYFLGISYMADPWTIILFEDISFIGSQFIDLLVTHLQF